MIGKLILAILASVMIGRADQASDRLIAAGIGEFSGAFRAWDERFGKAAETFREATVKDPKSALAFYWRGVALFHQMLQLKNPPDSKPNPKAAEAAMDAAIAALESAVRLDSGNAESHALLGTLYGMKINGSMIAAIRFGPGVQEHQKLALKNGATNPRVRYLLGAGQLHTAKDAAAKREALNTLLAAEKLFSHEMKRPANPLAPRWGYSSCLTFIGRACEMSGETANAVAYYRKALAAHPLDHLAANGIKRLTAN